jgi:hypothetical protein
MSSFFRLAFATGLAVAIVSNLHAAPVCSSIAAKRQPTVAVAPHQNAQLTEQTQACAKNCQLAGLQATDPKTVLPAPPHLPVFSAPDEVAAWHAEIFEQIAASRAQSTQYCKLDL